MSREIPLTQGLIALVDDDNYEEISQFNWHAKVNPKTKRAYAVRWNIYKDASGAKKKNPVYMHHQVMGGRRDGFQIDHISRDSLDNRKVNLRWATPSQNCMNAKFRVGKSGYRGVHVVQWGYQATVNIEGKRTHVGFSKDPVVAAKAYDEAARKHYGEFAILNFPESQPLQGRN